jgi:purine catabolism regulator
MNRLMEREQASVERMAHRTIIDDIRSGNSTTDGDTAARAAALGVTLTGRRLFGAVARLTAPGGSGSTPSDARVRDVHVGEAHVGEAHVREALVRDAAETIAAAVREAGPPALVGAIGRDEIALILVVPAGDRDVRELLQRVMRRVREAVVSAAPGSHVSLAVGSAADGLGGLRRSLGEAQQIALAAPGLPDGKAYHELSDIHIRGLLHLLGDDPRLQTFVEHELGALLMYDSAHGTDLIETLTTYLANGRNKTAAATAAGMSRPAFYQRLERIQRILSTDLESTEACLSLHVAVLGLDALRHARTVTG